MAKIDLKKQLSNLYKASADRPALVDVPPMKFLMVDCHGDPNTAPEFQDVMSALYTMAYSLKFALVWHEGNPKQSAPDYSTAALNPQWLMTEPTTTAAQRRLSAGHRQPAPSAGAHLRLRPQYAPYFS